MASDFAQRAGTAFGIAHARGRWYTPGLMRQTLAACALALSVACSSPGHPGGSADAAAGNAGTSGSGGSGLGGSSGVGGASAAGGSEPSCNDLVLDAPAVGFSYDAGPAPAALGGSIADGTYFLTAQIVYDTASGPTDALGRTEVEVAGTTWQEVDGDPTPSTVNPDRHFTNTLSITDTTLDLTQTCPSGGGTTSSDFSADATAVTVYITDAGLTIGTVFTKQ